MKWTQTQPSVLPVTYQQAADHLRLLNDSQRDYVLDLIAAATEYAETALGTSLITRNVTAIFNSLDPLYLPRGPVQSITSITSGPTHQAVNSWSIEGYGHADLLVIQSNAWIAPLTVTFVAGFGDTADRVPADLRLAIRMHVATLFENRESVSDKAMMTVPHGLADFYRQKSRELGIG
jgi:uncharacterized phiE125 gp8 family phage protein